MSQEPKETSVRRLLPISILILVLMFLPYVIALPDILDKPTSIEPELRMSSVELLNQEGVWRL